MRQPGLWIRNRSDGITELSPTLSPLDRGDRWLIIFTVAICASAFFVVGSMPGSVFLTLLGLAVAGEIVLGAKALLLLLFRPEAEVHEVRQFQLRRR